MDDEMLVSYQGVPPGVPVLTRDGEQFGTLEHVLEVPELDVFDGIVVATGASPLTQRTRTHLRFVDAGKVAAITAGYIRCDLDRSEVGLLRPPADDSPAYYANAIDQARRHEFFGRMFGRAHWRRE